MLSEKSKLKDGTPMIVFTVRHFVKIDDFSIHLTDHFYKLGEDFDNNLKKKEALKILQSGLFHTGLRGEYMDGFFEASFEISETRNLIFNDAKKWVGKNYPYLK